MLDEDSQALSALADAGPVKWCPSIVITTTYREYDTVTLRTKETFVHALRMPFLVPNYIILPL